MKPRLKWWRGVWLCRDSQGRYGSGGTPVDAYYDWMYRYAIAVLGNTPERPDARNYAAVGSYPTRIK